MKPVTWAGVKDSQDKEQSNGNKEDPDFSLGPEEWACPTCGERHHQDLIVLEPGSDILCGLLLDEKVEETDEIYCTKCDKGYRITETDYQLSIHFVVRAPRPYQAAQRLIEALRKSNLIKEGSFVRSWGVDTKDIVDLAEESRELRELMNELIARRKQMNSYAAENCIAFFDETDEYKRVNRMIEKIDCLLNSSGD